MSFSYQMGWSTVCYILKVTCEALWKTLQPRYVKAPSSEADWRAISSDFEKMWNFPHCIGTNVSYTRTFFRIFLQELLMESIL